MSQFGTPGTIAATPFPARGTLPTLTILAVIGGLLLGCTPTVRVEAPKEPIRIDLNITADVRVKVENAVDEAIDSNPDIF